MHSTACFLKKEGFTTSLFGTEKVRGKKILRFGFDAADQRAIRAANRLKRDCGSGEKANAGVRHGEAVDEAFEVLREDANGAGE